MFNSDRVCGLYSGKTMYNWLPIWYCKNTFLYNNYQQFTIKQANLFIVRLLNLDIKHKENQNPERDWDSKRTREYECDTTSLSVQRVILRWWERQTPTPLQIINTERQRQKLGHEKSVKQWGCEIYIPWFQGMMHE